MIDWLIIMSKQNLNIIIINPIEFMFIDNKTNTVVDVLTKRPISLLLE